LSCEIKVSRIIVECTAVQSAMPALLERHMSDLNATEQLKRERQLDNKEVVRRDGGPTSDSDDNAAEDNHDAAASSAGEKQKRIIAPRKKFQWTPTLRCQAEICMRFCNVRACTLKYVSSHSLGNFGNFTSTNS